MKALRSRLILGAMVLVILVSPQCNITPSLNEIDNFQTIDLRESFGDIPLNDPESFTYNGINSGLYPWGNQLISNNYKTNYINTSKAIRPLNSSGLQAKDGKIAILGIGGSNQFIVYNGIKNAWLNDVGFGKKLVFINAGTGGKDLPDIIDPNASYWSRIKKILDSNFVTASQIQIVFCIEDDFKNSDTSFQRAYSIRDQYINLLNTITIKYPNVKLIFIGDRGFNGYATLPKYNEPRGYLNGWAVKFLVEDYVNGILPQYPFINWLEYYWANGAEPRWDGLTYLQSDFTAPEYTHLTPEKANALGLVTHGKLKQDAGALYWYK